MPGKIENASTLLRQSWSVVKADKSILRLPIAGMLCGFAAFGLAWLFLHLAGQPSLTEFVPALFHGNILPLLAYFFAYAVSAFAVTFCNTALVAIMLRRLRNEPATLADGLAAARQRLPLILQWSLFIATIGIFLRIIEERTFSVGSLLLARFFEIAFNVASFLVVPVIVVENKSPLAALKSSTKLLRKTWGKQLVGSLTLGTIFGFMIVFAVLFMIAGIGFIAAADHNAILIAIGVALVSVACIFVIIMGATNAAIDAVFRSALYLFATENFTPAGFTPAVMETSLSASQFPPA